MVLHSQRALLHPQPECSDATFSAIIKSPDWKERVRSEKPRSQLLKCFRGGSRGDPLVGQFQLRKFCTWKIYVFHLAPGILATVMDAPRIWVRGQYPGNGGSLVGGAGSGQDLVEDDPLVVEFQLCGAFFPPGAKVGVLDQVEEVVPREQWEPRREKRSTRQI